MLETIIAVLKPAKEVISFLVGKESDRLDHSYGAARDGVVQALRQIYFTPDGMRAILSELANGRTPSAAQIEATLIKFNDAEWRVGGSRRYLAFDHLGGTKELSLAAAEHLHQLQWDKINVRQQLQRELNHPLTMGHPIDPKVAQELLDQVDALNAQIIELERELNHRSHGR